MKLFLNGVPARLQVGDGVKVQFAGNTSYFDFTRGESNLSRAESPNPGHTFVFATGASEEVEQMIDIIAWAAGLDSVRTKDGAIWMWRFVQQS
jgi:hypothetical protein